MLRPCACLALLLLCACGQKGPLYLPDDGTGSTPVAPAEGAAGSGATAGEVGQEGDAPTTPTTPAAAPDRDEEARKRIPATPAPATRQ